MFSDKCPICGCDLIKGFTIFIELYCNRDRETHYYELNFKNDCNLIMESFSILENGTSYRAINNFLKKECIITYSNSVGHGGMIIPGYTDPNKVKAKIKSYIMMA